jgi:hypothetical protein
MAATSRFVPRPAFLFMLCLAYHIPLTFIPAFVAATCQHTLPINSTSLHFFFTPLASNSSTNRILLLPSK